MGCSSDKYSLPQENEEYDKNKNNDLPVIRKSKSFSIIQDYVLKNNRQKTELNYKKNKIVVVDLSALFYTEEELKEDYNYDDEEDKSKKDINNCKRNVFKKITNKIMNKRKKSIIEQNSLEEEANLFQNKNEENSLIKNNNSNNEEI